MPCNYMVSREEIANNLYYPGGVKYEITFETNNYKEYLKVKDLCEELIKGKKEGSNVNYK